MTQFVRVDARGAMTGGTSSLEGAIVSARASALAANVRLANERISGCVIESAVWTQRQCVLLAAGEGVQWNVESRAALSHNMPQVVPTEAIVLEFASGNRYAWYPHALLGERLGRPILGLAVSESTVFLYVKGVDVLAFMRVTKVADSSDMLYWDVAG
jgi:hypothetical protein